MPQTFEVQTTFSAASVGSLNVIEWRDVARYPDGRFHSGYIQRRIGAIGETEMRPVELITLTEDPDQPHA